MEKAKRVPKHLAKCLNCECTSKHFQLEEGAFSVIMRASRTSVSSSRGDSQIGSQAGAGAGKNLGENMRLTNKPHNVAHMLTYRTAGQILDTAYFCGN